MSGGSSRNAEFGAGVLMLNTYNDTRWFSMYMKRLCQVKSSVVVVIITPIDFLCV